MVYYIVQRFWDKVDKTGDCWEWTASRNRSGYGQFKLFDHGDGKQKVVEAHRLAWELARGPIPDGLCVCHHCDNPGCVRPDHLFLGTHKDNAQDKHKKGRANLSQKYSDVMIIRLREEYASGLSSNQLATKYNINRKTVLHIINGKSYRNTGGPIRDPSFRYRGNRFKQGIISEK